jgi:hypothetical protein
MTLICAMPLILCLAMTLFAQRFIGIAPSLLQGAFLVQRVTVEMP